MDLNATPPSSPFPCDSASPLRGLLGAVWVGIAAAILAVGPAAPCAAAKAPSHADATATVGGFPSPQGPAGAAQGNRMPTLAALLADMRLRSGKVKGYSLEMTSVMQLPNGLRSESRSSLRVLSTTHFAAKTVARYSDGLEGVSESVRTPEGILVYEQDPTVGRVFFRIDPKLMGQLDKAQKALLADGRRDAGTLGAGPDPESGPHGHQVLAELATQFDVKVVGRAKFGGESVFRVAGPARGVGDSGLDLPVGDRVEALVRERDRAMVKIVQSRGDKTILEIQVTQLAIDPPMRPRDFALNVSDLEPVDVKDYPPAWQQIQKVLADARAIAERKKAAEQAGKPQEGGRDGGEATGGKDR